MVKRRAALLQGRQIFPIPVTASRRMGTVANAGDHVLDGDSRQAVASSSFRSATSGGRWLRLIVADHFFGLNRKNSVQALTLAYAKHCPFLSTRHRELLVELGDVTLAQKAIGRAPDLSTAEVTILGKMLERATSNASVRAADSILDPTAKARSKALRPAEHKPSAGRFGGWAFGRCSLRLWGRVCNSHNLSSNILRRKNKIDTFAFDCALGRVRLPRCVELLGHGDAPNFFYASQTCCPIAIISGDNNSDQFAAPVLGEGTQKTVMTWGHPLGFVIGFRGNSPLTRCSAYIASLSEARKLPVLRLARFKSICDSFRIRRHLERIAKLPSFREFGDSKGSRSTV